MAITVAPELGVEDLPASLVKVPVVAPTPARRISVAVKKSVAQHPAARRAAELLEAAVIR